MSFMREGDYEIGMWGQAHTYDPDLSALLSRTGASNHARYSNEDMDRLLTEGTETVVAEDRYPIYEEVQRIFKEDAPIIPLYSESVYSVQDKRLDGGVEAFYPAPLVEVHEWEFTE